MPARKARNTTSSVSGNSRKRTRPIDLNNLLDIEPLTKNQERFFESYKSGKHIIAHGVAGTGKSFICLYNALKEVLDYKTPYDKIYIVRSLVPTREIGFLPGMAEDKASLYEIPYKNMVKGMFDFDNSEQYETLYSNLKLQGTISFWSTSFIRGTTFDRAIIIVDEFENLSFHENDSIITRVGEDCKICFCGDAAQSDLTKLSERNGIIDFMRIINQMDSFDVIEFGIDDIVRSDFVKQYIIAKYNLGIR